MRSFRQGDVFIAQVRNRERTGKSVSDNGRVILAYGEVTGHAHEVLGGTVVYHEAIRREFDEPRWVFDDDGEPELMTHEFIYEPPTIVPEPSTDVPPAQFFEEPDGTRYLFVDRPCMLVHQEHAPIALTPGTYRAIRQREYVAPDLNRLVAD